MRRAILVAALAASILAISVSAGALDRMTIMLDWVANTNHTGIFVALEKGYYKDAGLDVEVLEQSQGLAVEQLVAAGKVDFGISSQEWAMAAMAEGLPIVSVAAIIQHNTTAYVSLKKAGLTRARDFQGKRYASWGLPLERAMISDVVKSDSGDPSKLKELIIGSVDLLAILGRDVDIAWIFMGWQGIEARQRGIELNAVMLRDIPSIPDYYTPIIITSRKTVDSQGKEAKAFMSATARGYTFAAENPAEAARILIRRSPEINQKLATESQQWLSTRYIEDATAWGVQKASVWKGLYDWMVGHGLVASGLDSGRFFTNGLLQ